MNSIREIEFQISYCMKTLTNFDDMAFMDFMWIYDRLKQEKENEAVGNGLGQHNLLDNMEDLKRIAKLGK